jgi:prepilin-type N-terminal cleavage/methylation domain-containing protein
VHRAPRCPRAGFSLLELLVVMTITLVLTGLMLPALSHVRENAHRVVCSSNLRQIGLGMTMYAGDFGDLLPHSAHSEKPGMMQETMSLFHTGLNAWDGLGLLYSRHYVDAPEAFYCHSHHGFHPVERYEGSFASPKQTIYCNYQYLGHRDPNVEPPRLLRIGELHDETLVLVTDGLRTKRDFNHLNGMNALTISGSVHWHDDLDRDIYQLLPDDDVAFPPTDTLYEQIWSKINGPPPSLQ